tara:strand:- start:5864 stop:6235 length:372 start_codon:yes stop_codon:yes gene_type:complete
MAYLTTIELVQGDTLPVIEVTLKDSSEATTGQTLDPEDSLTFKPINLTSCTATMKVREVGATALTDTLTGAVTDAANGVVSFNLGNSTLATAGTFEGEVSYTNSSSKTQTVVELIKIKVRDDF